MTDGASRESSAGYVPPMYDHDTGFQSEQWPGVEEALSMHTLQLTTVFYVELRHQESRR